MALALSKCAEAGIDPSPYAEEMLHALRRSTPEAFDVWEPRTDMDRWPFLPSLLSWTPSLQAATETVQNWTDPFGPSPISAMLDPDESLSKWGVVNCRARSTSLAAELRR